MGDTIDKWGHLVGKYIYKYMILEIGRGLQCTGGEKGCALWRDYSIWRKRIVQEYLREYSLLHEEYGTQILNKDNNKNNNE